METSTSSLQLDYQFVASPKPIRALPSGVTNLIDLQITVSNPSLDPVPMTKFTIDIPTGEETSRAISMAVLPSPTYDATGAWKITQALPSPPQPGGLYTIAPKPGTSGQVLEPIVFTLQGIDVNHTPGTVPLTITEFPPPPTLKVADYSTYSLHKEPADYPVTNFWADPASLHDLDLPVTLHWTVSDQGKQYVYGLRIIDVGSTASEIQTAAERGSAAGVATSGELKDCVSDGNCYTWDKDGEPGVPVSSVNETTTFALDVVTAPSSGSRSVVTTVPTTVDVTVPKFSGNEHPTASPSGRLVRLHWLAHNAKSCSVHVDGVVETGLPPDTYRSGHLVTLAGPPGSTHFVSVIAEALAGTATATWQPEVTITAPPDIPVGRGPCAIAFTPDSTLALVTNSGESSVTVIDVRTLTAEATTIPVGSKPHAIAITPDGTLAFTADGGSDSVTVIDIPTRTPEPNKIHVPAPTGVAVTPDGKLLYVSSYQNCVAVVDIPTRSVVETIATYPGPLDVAVTPDGRLTFVATSNIENLDGCIVVFFYDGDQRKFGVPTHGGTKKSVALTPDGSLALVTNLDDNSLSFIDIDAFKVVASVTTGAVPVSVRITPDGSRALVANLHGPHVTIIDIARRTSADFGGGGASGVGIAPDCSLALIANSGADTIAVV